MLASTVQETNPTDHAGFTPRKLAFVVSKRGNHEALRTRAELLSIRLGHAFEQHWREELTPSMFGRHYLVYAPVNEGAAGLEVLGAAQEAAGVFLVADNPATLRKLGYERNFDWVRIVGLIDGVKHLEPIARHFLRKVV